MPILDAALAFALTMLVVATAVTQIVHIGQHFGKWYVKGLDKMLSEYFTKEVGSAIKRVIERLTWPAPLSESAAELVAAAGEFDWQKHICDTRSGDDREVSRDTLIEKLKNSYLAKKIKEELRSDTDAVYMELERRYKVVEEKATDRFRKRSRKWGTIIALVLAFVLNIDSIHIARSYVQSPRLRDDVVAQMDVITKSYEATKESVDDAEDERTLAALGKAIGQIEEQIKLLTDTGFPVGWSQFPHAGLRSKPTLDYENRKDVWGWILWLIGIAVTGVLAGIGSPFWFDAVTGISRAARARAVKKPAS